MPPTFGHTVGMSDFQTLVSRLKAEPPRELHTIAAKSGVPYSTLRKLRAATTKNPRIKTVERLRSYYTEQAA